MNNKHLDKIKKCLELSKSTNPCESANALNAAKKLMIKYGVSQQDMQFIDLGETISKSQVQKKPTLYVTRLINGIAKAFNVIPLIINTNAKSYAQFVGDRVNTMTAAYAFDVVYRQLKVARTDYVKTLHHRLLKRNKTARADAFCDGWVLGVLKNISFDEMTDEKSKQINDYINRDGAKTGQVKTVERKGGRYQDMKKGQEIGANVRVHKPVSSKENHKLSVF